MKKLEIDLLLQDLEDTNIQLKKKLKKLDTIITLYLEDNADTVQPKEEPKEEPKGSDSSNDSEINDEKSSEDNNSETPKTESEQNTENNIVDDLPHKEKIDNLPNDIKTLYRKIMIKTHPDKNKGVDDEYHSDLYKKAVTAKDENDKPTILLVAFELGLKEIYDIDEEHFGSIKKRIAEIDSKKKSMENSPFWIWYHSDNKHLRNVMISQITKMRVRK